jgi:hypothetical protein
MNGPEHYKQGQRYLSAASFFNVDPCGPAKADAKPKLNLDMTYLLIELANAHFRAAQVAVSIDADDSTWNEVLT